MGESEERLTGAFALNLRCLRQKRGVTRQVAADFCGASKSAWSRYESGERVPNLETAAKMADYLGVSIDKLARG